MVIPGEMFNMQDVFAVVDLLAPGISSWFTSEPAALVGARVRQAFSAGLKRRKTYLLNNGQSFMSETLTFEQAYELVDILLKNATKEQLADCARLLALNLAHHQMNNGEIPVEPTLTLLRSFERSEEHLNLLMEGMLNLIGVLVSVCGNQENIRH